MWYPVHAQNTNTTAGEILQDAYKKAGKENKKVLVMFHASWCGWCHKMDSSLYDISCRKMFDAHFVICHLTVDESKDKKSLETPGADEFRARFHGEKVGLPFWLILDKTGNLLADSRMRKPGEGLEAPGDNMGCPASKEEVAQFIQVLKNTSSLTEKELKVIEQRFSKNN
jgi:thiol-disulfide isomerase/thioredoxin